MAAPVVAGVAALVWSAFPSLTAAELRQLLSESAVDLGAPGRDDAFGAGRVDAWRAILQGHPRTLAD
jgi:subtilisin family serine protease